MLVGFSHSTYSPLAYLSPSNIVIASCSFRMSARQRLQASSSQGLAPSHPIAKAPVSSRVPFSSVGVSHSLNNSGDVVILSDSFFTPPVPQLLLRAPLKLPLKGTLISEPIITSPAKKVSRISKGAAGKEKTKISPHLEPQIITELEDSFVFVSIEKYVPMKRQLEMIKGLLKQIRETCDEYKEVVQSARAFMKSLVFDQLVDMKVYDELVVAGDRSIKQIRSLGGFVEGFYTSLISITKDENNKDYSDVLANVEVPFSFYSLLPCTPLDSLNEEARDHLISKVTEEGWIKIEATTPEGAPIVPCSVEPLIVEGYDPALRADVPVPNNVSSGLSANPSHPTVVNVGPVFKGGADVAKILLRISSDLNVGRVCPLNIWPMI
ncbi:UNVERIFIED_CONTAM: hypothetical protein Sindi_0910300 [Sesamum indicum]